MTSRGTDLVERIVTGLRGAPYGPDLERLGADGLHLLVLPDRGYAAVRAGAVCCLGAVDSEAGRLLLQAALAEVGTDVQIEVVLGLQQWALRVALETRLMIAPDVSLCVRGDVEPSPTYPPGGAYG